MPHLNERGFAVAKYTLPSYELAVNRADARELAEKIIDMLPALASQEAVLGVGLIGLGLAIGNLISTDPDGLNRTKLCDAMSKIIRGAANV